MLGEIHLTWQLPFCNFASKTSKYACTEIKRILFFKPDISIYMYFLLPKGIHPFFVPRWTKVLGEDDVFKPTKEVQYLIGSLPMYSLWLYEPSLHIEPAIVSRLGLLFLIYGVGFSPLEWRSHLWLCSAGKSYFLKQENFITKYIFFCLSLKTCV